VTFISYPIGSLFPLATTTAQDVTTCRGERKEGKEMGGAWLVLHETRRR